MQPSPSPWPAIVLDLGLVAVIAALIAIGKLEVAAGMPIITTIVGGQLMMRVRQPPPPPPPTAGGGAAGDAGALTAGAPKGAPPTILARVMTLGQSSVVFAIVGTLLAWMMTKHTTGAHA